MTSVFKLSSVLNKNNQDLLNKVKENNLLTGISLDLYELICNNSNKTVGELYQLYVLKYPTTSRSRNELAKRVNDLKNWGSVTTSGTVICGFTGRNASMWCTTGKLPNKLNQTSSVEAYRSPTEGNDYYTPESQFTYNTSGLVASNNSLPPTQDLVSIIDREVAIKVLQNLQFKSRVLATMSKLLFFVPGLTQKNKEVLKALETAIKVLRG